MFLTFEGIEGCGKTTQIKRLGGWLEKSGVQVTLTREPGGSHIGEPLRKILLSREYSIAPLTELLLYVSDRAEHLEKIIRPALARGDWVLCDRYGDATRAYQAFGRNIRREIVEQAHALATSGLEPDLTLFLRMSPETAVERARRRNNREESSEDKFEAEALAFHRRVAAGYGALAEEFPGRIAAVDAEGTPDEVFARILSVLESRHVLE
ncbi:MAG: dTMP kinase [Acidobacteriota bacterium]|jgi:dTMP kinase